MYRGPWRKWIKAMAADWGRTGLRDYARHECARNETTLTPALGVPGGVRLRVRSLFCASKSFGDVDSRHQKIESVYQWQRGAMNFWTSRFYAAAPLNRPAKFPQSPVRSSDGDAEAPPSPQKQGRKVNRAIVTRTIRLITDEGHEILTRMEALRLAERLDLDLVEVDGKQDPPVCKLMDYNKERFKERQREKEHKKKQSDRRRLDDVKEVRFSTRTEPNDLGLKAQMAQRLLSKGHRVKLTVIPHGNDALEPKGVDLINQMLELLQGAQKVEAGPRIEKQRAWVLIRPLLSGSKSDFKNTAEISLSRQEVQ